MPRLFPKPTFVVLTDDQKTNSSERPPYGGRFAALRRAAMKLGEILPEFDGVSAWIGTPLDPADFAGRCVLVHFWSKACPLCHDGATVVNRWRSEYYPRGLSVAGIYHLRPDETLEPAAATREAVESMAIDHPCALDGARILAGRFGCEYSPAYYLFDRTHRLRHQQTGNQGLERIEQLLARLI